MTEKLLPLFPLKVVLLPRTEIPLHIFEERYKEMIRKFEDGRMDILVRGQRRFELSGLDQEKSYLRGAAEFFEDEEGDVSPMDPRRKQAIELYQQLAKNFSSEQSTEPLLPPDVGDPQISFQIVSRVPVDLTFRQTLLEMRSEATRLDRTISYLQKMAVRLKGLARAQAKAGANGRSH